METLAFSALKFGAGFLAIWLGYTIGARTKKTWLGVVVFIAVFIALAGVGFLIGIPATTDAGSSSDWN